MIFYYIGQIRVNLLILYLKFLKKQVKIQKELNGVVKTEEKKYDANGTLLSETSDTGVTTSYSYDTINRVKEAVEVSKDGITKTTKTDYGYADQEVHTLSGMKSYQNLSVVTTTVNGKVQGETYTDGSGNTVREKSNGMIGTENRHIRSRIL